MPMMARYRITRSYAVSQVHGIFVRTVKYTQTYLDAIKAAIHDVARVFEMIICSASSSRSPTRSPHQAEKIKAKTPAAA